MRPAVSPDGQLIAHYWMTSEEWTLAITAVTGGLPLRHFPLSPTHLDRVVRWSSDGRALAFIDGVGGASNIWMQSLDRSCARTVQGRGKEPVQPVGECAVALQGDGPSMARLLRRTFRQDHELTEEVELLVIWPQEQCAICQQTTYERDGLSTSKSSEMMSSSPQFIAAGTV